MDEFLGWVYFSVVMHTTLGLADPVPSGSIRLMVGTPAPVGFTPVPWSATFTYFAAGRLWCEATDRRQRTACGADRGRAVGG